MSSFGSFLAVKRTDCQAVVMVVNNCQSSSSLFIAGHNSANWFYQSQAKAIKYTGWTSSYAGFRHNRHAGMAGRQNCSSKGCTHQFTMSSSSLILICMLYDIFTIIQSPCWYVCVWHNKLPIPQSIASPCMP